MSVPNGHTYLCRLAAAKARFDNRQKRPAHQPLPSLLSAAAAQAVQAIPEPTTSPAEPIPRSQHRQICTCPPRAKGSLNRRFEWFSLVTFFLQKKKVTRAGGTKRPIPRPQAVSPQYYGGVSRHLPIAVLRAAMGAI